MRHVIYPLVAMLLWSVAACQAVTGQSSLTFGLEEAGASGKDPGEAGKSEAGEGGESGAGKGGRSGDAGKSGMPGKAGAGAGAGGAGGTSGGGDGGHAAGSGDAGTCKPSVPDAPCNLKDQCGCPEGQACNVTSIDGAKAVVSCAKPSAAACPGCLCNAPTACVQGYSCVGANPGVCRQYCEQNSDCGSNGICKPVISQTDNKAFAGWSVCFETCSKNADCATNCCHNGSCSAAAYCDTSCTNNSDCANDGCCDNGTCKPADQCKVVADVANLQCAYGSEHYNSPNVSPAECAQCLTEKCCDSWAKCQQDKDCKCLWECLSRGQTREPCLTSCKITDDAPKANTWAECVKGNCAVCNDPMPTPPSMCTPATEVGFASGVCLTAPQCGCTGSQKCDVSGSGVTSCGPIGNAPPYGACTSDANCQTGYGCVGNVCMQYCAKENDPSCGGMVDACRHLADGNQKSIPGAFACFSCDPVDPQRSAVPYATCDGKCVPTVDGRGGCITSDNGAGTQGSSCANSTGQVDASLCAPGFLCETEMKKCVKFCHIGGTGECATGSCTSLLPHKFAGAVEIGVCI